MRKIFIILLSFIILCLLPFLISSCSSRTGKNSSGYGFDLYNAICNKDYEAFDKLITNSKYSVDSRTQSVFESILSPDHVRYSALEAACKSENLYFAEKLIERGANPNHSSTQKLWSPLYLAILYSSVNENKDAYAIIEMLLENGANPNFTTSSDESLLHVVAYNSSHIKENEYDVLERQYNIAKLLLEYGADKTVVDVTSKTAYDYAVENGDAELAELLKP